MFLNSESSDLLKQIGLEIIHDEVLYDSDEKENISYKISSRVTLSRFIDKSTAIFLSKETKVLTFLCVKS